MEKTYIDLDGKRVLVTGGAGFIGSAVINRILETTACARILSLDNLNGYYDVALKKYRMDKLAEKASGTSSDYEFFKEDVSDAAAVSCIFREFCPDIVIHLAAQAGVRYSIDNPDVYIQSNIVGTFNILEACRNYLPEHLVYASSSSVYGGNTKIPFSESDSVDDPVSLYAASKKSNELMASCYARLYGIPSTGLRFFTAYGPAGRPDMFYYSATHDLISGKTIRVFNNGECERDFTYIDDIVEGVLRVAVEPPCGVNLHAVYNIGGSKPENLMVFLRTLTEELVCAQLLPEDFCLEDHCQMLGMQPGDVPVTYADSSKLETDFAWKPAVPIRQGLRSFVQWYKEYYGG